MNTKTQDIWSILEKHGYKHLLVDCPQLLDALDSYYTNLYGATAASSNDTRHAVLRLGLVVKKLVPGVAWNPDKHITGFISEAFSNDKYLVKWTDGNPDVIETVEHISDLIF